MSKEIKNSDTLIKNTEETERKKLCDKVLSMGPPTVSEIEEIWRRISAPPSWRDISSIYPEKKRD